MIDNNITVFLEVFNEAHRLEACLKTFQWADEVVVFVKKSSDDTLAIARRFATHVYEVAYCEASENFASNIRKHASKEWCFFITASSLIDPELSSEIVKLTQDVGFGSDVIGLPYAMYVLGISGKSSPWGGVIKYPLIRRSVLELSNVLHNEISWNSNKIFTINPTTTGGRFYHLTHSNPDEFFLRHMRYVKYEANQLRESHGKKALQVALVGLLRAGGSVVFKKRSIWFGIDGLVMSLAYVSYFLMRYIYVWHDSRFPDDPYVAKRRLIVDKWNHFQHTDS
jgi:glycosyltransferase involved in cell wall biosynthesis